jgi:hypothetical protein
MSTRYSASDEGDRFGGLRALNFILLTLPFAWLLAVLVYRLYLHPLAKYPGPWYQAISGWYDFYIAYNERRHLHFEKLHQKYGPIVRYGPNELAFNSPKAFTDMYNFKANTKKGQVTVVAASTDPETTSTFSEPDTKRAMKKRKLLSQGFSESALASAEGKSRAYYFLPCLLVYAMLPLPLHTLKIVSLHVIRSAGYKRY